jgi:hypothetical protein
VQTAQLSPELADAADVLSDQLRVHLQRLAVLIEPHSGQIEKKFLNRLRSLSFEPRQRSALAAITVGRGGKNSGERAIRRSSSSNRWSTTVAGWPS